MTQRLAYTADRTLPDNVLLLLDNDNLSLLHLPTFLKQEATFAIGNQRDSLAEHIRQLDQLKPKAVFLETRMLSAYHSVLVDRGCLIVIMDRKPDIPAEVYSFWDLVEAASDKGNDVELDLHEHVAMLRFSSGTTGRSKCAMYSVDNLLACRDSGFMHLDFGYSETTRFLTFTPLSHAPTLLFLPTLFAGGTTYTLNTPDLVAWSETVQAERITLALLVPTLLYRLLDMDSTKSYDFSSLRTIGYGASPIAPSAVRRLIERFGPIFVQGYGATETYAVMSVLNKRDHNVDTDLAQKRLSSAGRVSPDVELIVTDENGNALPVGETGEIWLRSRATISGYYDNPEDTASEFKDGFWKSGDLGYLDERGYLFIVDRKKDMIITGGLNVYAVEVEAALAEHPAVLMSAVVGVPHKEWGEAVHAEVVIGEGRSVTEEELIAHVKASHGSYKAPKTIHFVEELPLSPAGKVLRRIVKQRYWSGQERLV